MMNKEEILEKIKQKEWFINSSEEIRFALLETQDSFLGFLEELANRPEKINNILVKKMIAISFGNHFALPIFEVVNEKTGEVLEYEFVGRKRGRRHSIRGLIMVESSGELEYFIVRKSSRFAVADELYESIGSIYPPDEEIQKENYSYQNYLEQEIAKLLRLKQISFERFYDLGCIYPDVGLTNHIVSLFAAVISTDDPQEVMWEVKDKIFDDKNYDYSLETISATELLKFLSKTNDAHLLAIFGRLQALNVIRI